MLIGDNVVYASVAIVSGVAFVGCVFLLWLAGRAIRSSWGQYHVGAGIYPVQIGIGLLIGRILLILVPSAAFFGNVVLMWLYPDYTHLLDEHTIFLIMGIALMYLYWEFWRWLTKSFIWATLILVGSLLLI